MSCRYLVIAFFALFLCAGLASAQPLLSWNMVHDDMSDGIARSAHAVEVTVSGINESYDSYRLFGWAGLRYFSGGAGSTWSHEVLGEVFTMDITENGAYVMDCDFSLVPRNVYIDMRVYAVPLVNGSYAPRSSGLWGIIEDEIVMGVPLDKEYILMARHVSYDNVMMDGVQSMAGVYRYHMSGDTRSAVHFTTDHGIFLTIGRLIGNSAYREAFAHVSDSSMRLRTSVNLDIPGYESLSYGFQGRALNARPGLFDVNESYHVYWGIRTLSDMSMDNFMADIPGTQMMPHSFDALSINHKGWIVHDLSASFKFHGSYARVEPSIGAVGSDIGMGALSVGTFGQWVMDYGERIHVPFLWVIVVVAIVLLFTMVPFGFATRHGFSLPNFVYALTMGTGMLICYSIGLVTLFMFILFLLILMTAVVFRYKEFIQKVVSTERERYPMRADTSPLLKGKKPPKGLPTGTLPASLVGAGSIVSPITKKEYDAVMSAQGLIIKPDLSKGFSGFFRKKHTPQETYVRRYFSRGGMSKEILMDKKTGRKVAERKKGKWV